MRRGCSLSGVHKTGAHEGRQANALGELVAQTDVRTRQQSFGSKIRQKLVFVTIFSSFHSRIKTFVDRDRVDVGNNGSGEVTTTTISRNDRGFDILRHSFNK